MSSGSGSGTPATSSASATIARRSRYNWGFSGILFTLERILEPELEPVTLAEMRQHLRIFADITSDDDQISALITAAREWVEDYTGRALVDQTWRLTVDASMGLRSDFRTTLPPGDSFASNGIGEGDLLLRRSPVLAINGFVTADAAGVETALDVAAYALCEQKSKWPRLAAIGGGNFLSGTYKIEYRAGYVDLTGSPQQGMDLVPERYKQAIKLWVEANYDRDPVMMEKLLMVAENLIRSERVEMGFA